MSKLDKPNLGTVTGPVSTERWAYLVWGALHVMTRLDGTNIRRAPGPIDSELRKLVTDETSADGAIEAAMIAGKYARVTGALAYLRELRRQREECPK